jgi:3-oxoacyl-[acyl-carrier protein] reductase
MLLYNKNAVIYGAAGSLGSAIAHAFAQQGAKVFVTGNKLLLAEQTACAIISKGGKATAMQVDALNEEEVNSCISRIEQEGGADISFNLIQYHDVQGIPLVDMKLEDFTRPVFRAAQSHFITATAAARSMIKKGSGVILSLTATPGGIGYPLAGGFGPCCKLIENFSMGLASETGPYGVRSVNIRSAGSPDSGVFMDAVKQDADAARKFIKKIEDDTMLKKMPLMKDIANTAVFLASDMAAGITGVTVDVTCGTTTALNYKAPPIAFVTSVL